MAPARRATIALLERRSPDATLCPSEVARALVAEAGAEPTVDDWRRAMPAVHAAIDQLLAEGIIGLSWKGRPLTARARPYRIGGGSRE